MIIGAGILTVTSGFTVAIAGMVVFGTRIGIANAAVFGLVPVYVPDAVGGASGWIGGLGGAGTLFFLPVLALFTDYFGPIGYVRGFSVCVILNGICALISLTLKFYLLDREKTDQSVAH